MNDIINLPSGAIHRLNWKKEPEDRRDIMRTSRVFRGDLPMRADVLEVSRLLEIWDQGVQGSCTGHGGGRCANIVLIRELQSAGREILTQRLSPAFAYWNARLQLGTTGEDSGAYIRNVVRGIVKYGICLESLMPYNDADFLTPPSATAYDQGKTYQALIAEKIKTTGVFSTTLDGVRSALAEGYPVVFGMTLFDSFRSVGKDGIVPDPDPKKEDEIGGHCMALVGYERETDRSDFIVENSWGSEWSDGGRCYISSATLKKYADDLWAIRKMETGDVEKLNSVRSLAA